MKTRYLSLILLLTACSSSPDDLADSANEQAAPLSSAGAEMWSQGGSLHFASALDWQKASYQNKRATSSDFLKALQQQGKLKSDLADPVLLKQYSEELTAQLNERFEMTGTATENERTFKDKSVSEAISVIAAGNGWLKDN